MGGGRIRCRVQCSRPTRPLPGHSARQGRRQGDRRDARAQRREDARGDGVDGIPRGWVDEIILVDDSSTDDTVELARKLPLHVVWHPHNVGYGGNQKTCYLEALQRDADVVVMLHPDGQYEPGIIPRLVEPIVRRRRRHRARLALPRPRRRARGRHAVVEARGQPRADDGREPADGHRSLRAPHRLPRVLAPAAARGPVPAQLARLRVRHRAADAGRRTSASASTRSRARRSTTTRRRRSRSGRASSTESSRWGPGARLVLHRRGIWRSKKFQA